jgi:hypothetical protein
VRCITGIALFIPALLAVRHGYLLPRLMEGLEAAAALVFCMPRVWRVGAYGLLAVMAVAFAHHALQGEAPVSLLFPAMVVILELAHERP